ncbi:MAG: hypothetical protein DRP86_06655 [Candidatus Neomarinimicrobiota bacterium]|nr:MAG: hypothetical protein DRP86_06655 [Candidatus Neomarinimicrobiota bacterium]
MKRFIFSLTIMLLSFIVCLTAADARSYLIRYNDQMNKISTLEADLLVSSRMPGFTLADQRGKLRYLSPDEVDISGGLKDVIPPEAILINLHHVLMDSSVTVLPDVETVAGGVILRMHVQGPAAGRLDWTVTMDTIRWYIREIFVRDPKGNTVNILFRQRPVLEDLYLPQSIEVLMTAAEEKRRVPNPRRQRIARPGDEQSGTMTIRLNKYRINDPEVYEFFHQSMN